MPELKFQISYYLHFNNAVFLNSLSFERREEESRVK